jgi:radical SAM protein with 4Fe4S-binding SPASM domain
MVEEVTGRSRPLIRFRRTPLDRVPRLKTWLALRWQDPILGIIDRLPVSSLRSRVFRRTLQRLVGGVLWSIKLEVNNACNLSCRMCYAEKGEDLLPMADIKRLLDDISDVGTRLEILGGEPLLRDDLAEVIRYAKGEAHVPQVVLYTNALGADRSRAEELCDAGLDAAIVNLVSCNEEEHDTFVGKDGAWRITTTGIAHLREAGIEVYTFSALHRANVHRVKKIYTFVKEELGAHALFYQYIPQVKDDPLTPDKEAWAAAKRFVLCDANRPHARFVRNFCTLVGSACSGGYFVLTVKVDGTVTPCPFISDIPLGNIKERSIWEIMRGRFSVAAFVEFQSLPAECRGCAYSDICNGGCKAGNAALFGRYDRKDNRCLGPWEEQIQEDAVCDRLPCFF